MSGRQGRPTLSYSDHQAEHAAEILAIQDATARAQLPQSPARGCANRKPTRAQHAAFVQVREAAGRYRVAQVVKGVA